MVSEYVKEYLPAFAGLEPIPLVSCEKARASGARVSIIKGCEALVKPVSEEIFLSDML